MRASYAALVLATVAIANVAAHPAHNHQHAHLHKKEAELNVRETAEVEEKRQLADVNWATVHYTYSSGQTWGQPTPAPAPAAAAAAVATSAAAPVKAAATAAASSVKAAASSAGGTSSATGSLVDAVLSAADLSFLTGLGAMAPLNSKTETSGIWLAAGGQFEIEFTNDSSEDLIVVCWGPWGSWINANQPLIAQSLSHGQSFVASFADGLSGGCCPMKKDTTLKNGQCFNGWVEFTMDATYGTIDISYEPNMNGSPISVTTAINCKCDQNTCVFKCAAAGVEQCTDNYVLENCAAGSQPGAQHGTYDGADSGGCQIGPNGGKSYVTFS